MQCSSSSVPRAGSVPELPQQMARPGDSGARGGIVKDISSEQIKIPSGCQSPLTNILFVHNVHCSCSTFGPELNVGLTDSLCSVSAGRRLQCMWGPVRVSDTQTANQRPLFRQLGQSEASIELERAGSGCQQAAASPAVRGRRGLVSGDSAQSIICDGDHRLDTRTPGIRNTAWPPVH